MDISLVAHHIQPITNDIMTANLDTNMKVVGTLRQRLDVTGTVHINHASITIPNGLPPSVRDLECDSSGSGTQPPPHRPRSSSSASALLSMRPRRFSCRAGASMLSLAAG